MRYTGYVKYQNLQAFEKHLREAFPAHLSRVYMVISPDPMERRRTVEKIAELLVQQGGGKKVFSCEEKEGFSHALELLRSQPLFESHWIVLLDAVDQLKKDEMASLTAYVASPSSFAYLIMSAEEAPSSADFYLQVKKELILLDMSGEKPWDKKTRLKEWLIAEAAREKKQLPDEAALFLLDRVGTDRAALEQEIFKLLTFAHDKKNLTLADVRTICSGSQQASLWKLAEELVWGEGPLLRQPPEDVSGLLAFITQVRTHLEMGLSQRAPQKYMSIAKKRGANFFAQALIVLFESEMKAKSLSLSIDLLWDLLVSKITILKANDATSLSKSTR